ncbi:MAG: helix-turn-helix domain-containing protein [Pseudonocardia sp.]
MTDQHDGRIGFGNRLRRLRHDADLSGKQLAERLDWPASKVSRLENGRQTASAADVDAWTGALGAPAPVRDELVEDLRSLRVEYATWRRQLRSGFAPLQRAGRLLEEGTTTVRGFQTSLMPGLLQTADYARAIYQGNAAIRDGPRDVEAAVHERLRRQELLYQPGHQFRFLLTEAALRARLCPAPAHRAQLDRLLVLAGLDTVELAVLPLSAELSKATSHGFVIFDDRLVLVETFNSELGMRDAEDVALYTRIFEMFWALAEHGERATALIARFALELPASERTDR